MVACCSLHRPASAFVSGHASCCSRCNCSVLLTGKLAAASSSEAKESLQRQFDMMSKAVAEAPAGMDVFPLVQSLVSSVTGDDSDEVLARLAASAL